MSESRRRGCRYSDLGEGLCGNEVLSEDAELLLCPRHTASALRMVREIQARMADMALAKGE